MTDRDVARRRRALLSQAQLDIEKFAEFAARLVELDFAAVLATPARSQVPATQIDHLLRVAVPLRLDGLDLLEPFDLRRIVGDELRQVGDLGLERGCRQLVRREEALVTGDQEAAHGRFAVDRETQHFVGVADHALRMLGPAHGIDEVRDQRDEHRNGEETHA